MNILVLGDVVGPSGVKAVKEKLPKLIKEKKNRFCNCKWGKRRR